MQRVPQKEEGLRKSFWSPPWLFCCCCAHHRFLRSPGVLPKFSGCSAKTSCAQAAKVSELEHKFAALKKTTDRLSSSEKNKKGKRDASDGGNQS